MTPTHPIRAATIVAGPAPQPRARWPVAGLAALAMSGVALAALPGAAEAPLDHRQQWQALTVKPLSSGGATGLRMEPRETLAPIEAAPERERPFVLAGAAERKAEERGPVRIRGRVGDGLYWSLRSAGAPPDTAQLYLSALATALDVGGDIAAGDGFDLVLSRPGGALLYAGLDRAADADVQLVAWTADGRSQWIDAAQAGRPRTAAAGLILPASGRITSHFGHRIHPILRFTRFHAGLDIAASWGSPVVAAGDGQVVGASWAGGYGRQVRIIHPGGLVSSYSHMSGYAVAAGQAVRRGQVIGYVGSSGFSTGPHLHFEVRKGGVAVNPLAVRLAGSTAADPKLAAAVKARLRALLSVGTKRSA